jgi:hypothetical protein
MLRKQVHWRKLTVLLHITSQLNTHASEKREYDREE